MIELLAEKYGMDIQSLHTLNMQRLGVCTDLEPNAVRIDVEFLYKDKVFHIPFARNQNSPYKILDGRISLGDSDFNLTLINLKEDLPSSPYYFRGSETNSILVINSTFLSSCSQRCTFCEQTIAPPGKSRYSLKFSTERLFDKVMDEQNLPSLGNLAQISIVTSCAGTEERAAKLVLGYKQEAEKREFKGKILFASNEIRSEEALRLLADTGNIILAFTVECFANRIKFMPGSKGSISLERIREILSFGKNLGMETTYFYILGLDDLQVMRRGFTSLRDAIDIAPTCPTYQPQGGVDNIVTRPLEYFLEARKIYNEIHQGIQQFESCQNFKSLDPLKTMLSRTIIE